MNNKKILVMGVSGCGKSLIGQKIADAFSIPFFDGDDFHPEENVKKMQQGTPLNDDDREGWLITLNQLIKENEQLVFACSALKPHYREMLKEGNEALEIIYLQGSFDTIWNRHQKREDHYFNGKSMLESQFATLIEPKKDEAHFIDIAQSIESVVSDALTVLKK